MVTSYETRTAPARHHVRLVFVLSRPVFGLVAFAGSAALWRFQAKQIANVESGYAQHLASAKS